MNEENSKSNLINDQVDVNKFTNKEESINKMDLNLDNELNNETKNLVNGHLNSQQNNDKLNFNNNQENNQLINELTNGIEQERSTKDFNISNDNSDYKSLNESSIEDTDQLNEAQCDSSKTNSIRIKDQTEDNEISLDNKSLNESIENSQQFNESNENNQQSLNESTDNNQQSLNDSTANNQQSLNESNSLLSNQKTSDSQSNNDSIIEVSTNEQSLNKTTSSIEEITINESSDQVNSNEFTALFGNSDLLKRLIKKGDEKILKPERGCQVVINLEVRNHDTKELIESESQNNLTVFVGDFDILHGVDLALTTMHKNEIAEILIKSQLAYGTSGKQPDIPSDCTLICNVELLKIIWPNELCCASLNDLSNYFEISKRKKERGNFYFKRSNFEIALHCYNRSGEILDFLGQEMLNRHHMLTDCLNKVTEEIRKNEIQQELNSINDLSVEFMKIKFDVFNNLSMVLIKLNLYNQAFDTVNNALNIKPTDVKALYRKTTILTHKGRISEAIDCLKEAIRLEPKNKIFLKDLNKLKIKLDKDIKTEKALYTKMLQPEKKKTKKSSNQKQKSSNKFNYLAAGVFIGGIALSSYLIYRKLAKN